MSRRINRRRFLQSSALAGVGFWVAGGVALSREGKAANDKINIACIGVGGKGSSDVDGARHVGQIVALCDVDEDFLNNKAAEKTKEGALKFPDAQKFFDYRELLTKLGDKIDAVTVSTPDHTHAPAALMAMKMGKHVYVQKPLTHTVAEARAMRETAAKMKVCTQMGNQGTAENGLREAVEIIRSGAIGPVKEVHVWTNRPVWPQAPEITDRPKEEQDVPKWLHWDLWLGTAPKRPFYHRKDKDFAQHRGMYHDFNWRGWWDFGTGALGDMACHTANLPFMALKLGQPTTIQAESGEVNPETYPAWARIAFEFPARGGSSDGMPALKFFWYEGKKSDKKVLPPDDLVKIMNDVREKNNIKDSGSGSFLVGEKGMLFSPDDYGARYFLLPEEKFKDFKKPEPTLPRNGKGDDGMKMEWAEAIRSGKPADALSNFDYAATLTETILLGNVAIRAGGKKLEYDGSSGKVANNADADKWLKTEYRKDW
jgi:predicted dehydrogenase